MNEFKLLLRKDLFILINNLKLILKNPLRLLPYAAFIGYFSFIYISRSRSRAEKESINMDEVNDALASSEKVDYIFQNVSGGITLLVLAFFIFQLFRATKKNVSFFTMADVNLLFTSPVSPSNILIYYMVRSLLPAIGGSLIFLAYGGSNLAGTFDLTTSNMIFMAIGIALFFFMLSPIKFLIYTLNTKYGILPQIKQGILSLAVVLGLMVLIPGLMAEKFWQGMFAWIGSKWFDFFPIVGWSRGIFTFLTHENHWIALGFILVYGIAFFLILKLVILHSGAYYEDVLDSTQSNEEVKEKAKGKKQMSESNFSLNAGKKLSLPDFGTGAKALFWRNYIHSSRQDFHPLFGLYSLIMVALGILFAVLSLFDWFSHQVIYGYLLFLIFIYFMAGMGRTNVGDLKKPFFILIPASWSSKFWNMIKLDVYQMLIFSVILIIPAVLIASLSWGLIPLFLICMVTFYLTGFSITLSTTVGFDEGWDRKLIKPLIIGGVLIFGIVPSLGAGVFFYIVSKQFVFGMMGVSMGMAIVAAVLLNLTLDIVKRVEFKEI